jgi:hypothetical protein
MHESIETLFDSKDFPSKSNGRFDGRPDDRVQCRTVSTARENSYSHNNTEQIVLEDEAVLKLFHRLHMSG